MKYIGIALLAAALLGATAPSKNVTITVNGEATVSRPADVATVSLAITTTDPVAQTATSSNNSRYNDLRNRLRAIGIADPSVRTLSYNLNYLAPPQAEARGEGGIQRPYPGAPQAGYTVSRQVEVTLTNLDLVGKVVDEAVGANVSNVYNVGYTISNYRQVYAQALKEAVADAQLQAKAMSSAAGMRIVRISAMQTGGYAQPIMMRAMSAPAAAPQIPTEIPAGPMDVRASVTITYVIAP